MESADDGARRIALKGILALADTYEANAPVLWALKNSRRLLVDTATKPSDLRDRARRLLPRLLTGDKWRSAIATIHAEAKRHNVFVQDPTAADT